MTTEDNNTAPQTLPHLGPNPGAGLQIRVPGAPTQRPADDGGTYRHNAHDGVSRTLGVTRSQTMGQIDMNSGVLASARTRIGGPPPAQITDKTIVRFKGVDMQVRHAVMVGALRHNGTGGYEETGREAVGQQGSQPQPVELPSAHAAQPLEAGAATAVDNLRAALKPSILNRVIESVITKGRGAPGIPLLANDLGIDAADLNETVAAAAGGFQRQADEVVTGMGFDPAHFYQWARTHYKNELRNAMREHFHGLGVESYVALADKYARNVAPDTATLTEGGLPTFYDRNTHEQMVTVRGVTMTVKAAAKAGLI